MNVKHAVALVDISFNDEKLESKWYWETPIRQSQQSKLQVKTLEEEGEAKCSLYSSGLRRNCIQTLINQVGGNDVDYSIYRMILLVEKQSNISFNT